MDLADLGTIRLIAVVAVSLIAGAAMSTVMRRIRGGRAVRNGLTRIEFLRQESSKAPLQVLAATSQLMASFQDRLIAGRLSQAEHQILASRGASLMHKIVATQLEGPLAATSQGFRNLTWAVLEDNHLSNEEAKVVRKALANEAYLNASQVAHIHQVLDAWQGEPPSEASGGLAGDPVPSVLHS